MRETHECESLLPMHPRAHGDARQKPPSMEMLRPIMALLILLSAEVALHFVKLNGVVTCLDEERSAGATLWDAPTRRGSAIP